MIRSLKDLERYAVSASDGDIGTVMNFLLDDARWVVRYLVVETGSFFEGRHVLISPISFREVDGSSRHFHLALTMEKIKNSPSVDVDKPVSRQHEREYYQYYDYPLYWGYAGVWGTGAYPGMLAAGNWRAAPAAEPDPASDVHLRSAREIRGYHVEGTDGEIGHIEDIIVDDETWEARYLVINTSNWWFGKSVLVAPGWASRVSWDAKRVHVDMSRGAIQNSPEWVPSAGINREYETRLYDYYGRPAYWDAPARPAVRQPPHHHPG